VPHAPILAVKPAQPPGYGESGDNDLTGSDGFDFVGFSLGHGGGGGGHGGGHGGRGYGGGWWGGPWWEGDGLSLYATSEPDDEDLDAFATKLAKKLRANTVVGMFDFNVEQKKMDSLKQFPVTIAQSLLAAGQAAINGAIAGAKQPWYKSDLPGDTDRQAVQLRLQGESITVAAMASTPNTMYPNPSGLKSAVLAAFEEANAVETGAAYLQTTWDRMWSEIETKIAALPKDVAAAISKALPSYMKWGIGIGAGVLAVAGGLVAYKKLA
jgi:hypothetical protein